MPLLYRIFLMLRHLPWYRKIYIVALSFIILEIPVAYLMSIGIDRSVASILFIAGALAALLFQWHKAFVVQCTILGCHIAIVIYIKGWSYPSIPTIVSATIANFLIIWTVGGLRHGWSLSEAAIEKQKDLAVMKDQFIANVTHEMRSPLTGAMGFLDILKDSREQLDAPEQTMYLDQAIYACGELQRLADNILDAMRCDNDVSPPCLRNFDVGKVVIAVLRHIDTSDYSIGIDIPEEIIANGDSQQVGQVVRNLLSNCFKYAPQGSTVSVRIWCEDAFACVCVCDQGPGIAPEKIPQIFQKFSRLERDVAGPIRGIGLGLYICRRFIEQMGGRIWVESTGIAGEGSSFYFTVPLAVESRNITKKG